MENAVLVPAVVVVCEDGRSALVEAMSEDGRYVMMIKRLFMDV